MIITNNYNNCNKLIIIMDLMSRRIEYMVAL